jgi:hypothetical protein
LLIGCKYRLTCKYGEGEESSNTNDARVQLLKGLIRRRSGVTRSTCSFTRTAERRLCRRGPDTFGLGRRRRCGLDVRGRMSSTGLLEQAWMHDDFLFEKHVLDVRYRKVEVLELPGNVCISTQERHFREQPLGLQLRESSRVAIIMSCTRLSSRSDVMKLGKIYLLQRRSVGFEESV